MVEQPLQQLVMPVAEGTTEVRFLDGHQSETLASFVWDLTDGRFQMIIAAHPDFSNEAGFQATLGERGSYALKFGI